MSTPAANSAASGSNDALRAAHNQLKFVLWDDMEETRHRVLETRAERMEWLEDCFELLTRFKQLGGDWDSVPVRKFFDVVANAVQNLPNSSWAQRVIFEFPCIVEFFPRRRVPSGDTRPLSSAPELVAAPAVPLVPRPSMPRVTFAPLPPIAPPRTLPSPGTLVDLTFCLARTASLPSRLIDPDRSPSGRALPGSAAYMIPDPPRPSILRATLSQNQRPFAPPAPRIRRRVPRLPSSSPERAPLFAPAARFEPLAEAAAPVVDADGEEEAASDGEEEVEVPQPAAKAAARGSKTKIQVHGGVPKDVEHCLPLSGVPVPAGSSKYLTWSEKCYKCVRALSWKPCVFDFFEKDGTLAAKCQKYRAGLVAAPRTVRKGTRKGLNKRPRSSSGSSKDLQRPAKRFTIHIPARVISAPVNPSSHLVPPAAAAPRRLARLQATPLSPVVAPEPEVVPAAVKPSFAVEPAVLSGFGEATGPLAAVAGTTGTHAPSLSSSSSLPSYPASPPATPPPRFVTPLFTPPPLFLPALTSPDVPEVVPTALLDGLEGSDPGIETAEGRLRPPQLPAHPSVF
ncbi:hypothetical protein PHLCEN_2v6449 [Hermanssonia centrifuga]|uniref:Uncharacterized protein n=1 Tax=Hermanssonia centrifuga TaxID=98765 RepID=A0A2R6NZF7_9APHY|nr:hypothetical protein PHLCEN_2v6449 [Hermanssonia centrifuga]